MRKRIHLALFFIMLTNVIYSQITITGVVFEEGDTLSIPCVIITEKGTSNTVNTDINGAYTITVRDSTSTLVYSFIGFVTREIIVGNRVLINTTLKPFVIYEGRNQKLRLFLKSGLIQNPVGGQFEFSTPTFINALNIYGGIGYQSNFKDNEYFDASLSLVGVRLGKIADYYYVDVGAESNYRHIKKSNKNEFSVFSIEAKWWLSLPFVLFTGYSQINFEDDGKDAKNGLTLGGEFWFSKPMSVRVNGKATLFNGLTEYQAEARTRFGKFDRYHSFIKYYNINGYSELSLGVGVEFTYLFKHQRNEY
ncbi:carboxypeptidase-like regulatory domain-containing protein [Labilibacter marinus]|uniref:carboxypeptidase-like regulatory domain-containing protein n=1 Tax=Labilibacter marinus TaxID=1477105 RepID=UPI000830C6A0|nr:carboxypeptidase-like regulatory domain-containing protein [Labilibacter marinus]